MRIFCITQARMSSSRLPGKVMRLIGDLPLIAYHLARVQRSSNINQHWLAISEDQADDPLAAYLTLHNQAFYRGSEHDVLERFYQTALQAGATPDDMIIRLTGDCPLICPALLDKVITEHLAQNCHGYSHLSLTEYPRGFDTEIFSMAMLTEARNHAQLPAEREHVTMYFYTKQHFQVQAIYGGDSSWSQLRLCVDQQEDFELISQLALKLDTLISLDAKQICCFLKSQPQLAHLNAQVQQKTLHQH